MSSVPRAGYPQAGKCPLAEPTFGCDSRGMDRYCDPYDRLATLLWLLKPADVARLVAVADLLAERRLAALQLPQA